jgi:hypothetical protein
MGAQILAEALVSFTRMAGHMPPVGFCSTYVQPLAHMGGNQGELGHSDVFFTSTSFLCDTAHITAQ